METLKILVCGILCIQLLLSLTEGSSFHKYIKFFGGLMIMYMCCFLILSVFPNCAEKIEEAFSKFGQVEDFVLWEQK